MGAILYIKGIMVLIVIILGLIVIRYLYYFYKHESLKELFIDDLKILSFSLILSILAIYFRDHNSFKNMVKYSVETKIYSKLHGKYESQVITKYKQAKTLKEKILVLKSAGYSQKEVYFKLKTNMKFRELIKDSDEKYIEIYNEK